ncbi:MAG: hypothetical protein U0531_22535 [Dehalococcoidia bacterium]
MIAPPTPPPRAWTPAGACCAGGCAVECDARGVRWWAEGERIPEGAAFPLAPTRPAPALPLPVDWTL